MTCITAIENSESFAEVLRTRVGSPYVLAGMEQLVGRYECVAGGEANGGFRLGSAIEKQGRLLEALPARDALLPALTLMVSAARANTPLSQLVPNLPARYTASDRLKGFPRGRSQSLLALWQQDLTAMKRDLGLDSAIKTADTTDGLRVTLDNGEIVHLRPSGNAPELRCYAEAESEPRAVELVQSVLPQVFCKKFY